MGGRRSSRSGTSRRKLGQRICGPFDGWSVGHHRGLGNGLVLPSLVGAAVRGRPSQAAESAMLSTFQQFARWCWSRR